MPKREIFSYLGTLFFYVLFVTLAGRYFQLSFLAFWFGCALGVFLLYLDPVFSAYFAGPEMPFAQEVKQLAGQKRFKELIRLSFVRHKDQEQPLLHSALFQAALTFLGLYIVTSSGSYFGTGLILGMLLHLVKDEVESRKNPVRLNNLLFWNIHRPISDLERKIYLAVIFALFGLETLFLL